jgi:Ser/Thr protein kinase RdoA (MazF antagonist)
MTPFYLRSRRCLAVQAWRQVCPGVNPNFVEVLQEQDGRNCVYRLNGVGPRGTAVIAKRCVTRYAQVEQAVYHDILPHLPIFRLTFYGCVDESQSEYSWLFLEDAGGEEFTHSIETHRTLAARWLGQMHVAAALVPAISRIPDRGPQYYLDNLLGARESIQEKVDNPGMHLQHLRILEAILSQVNLLVSRWNRVEEVCHSFPRTLVHGDLTRDHVRVRSSARGSDFVVFDWGKAGYGIPAIDIAEKSTRGVTRDRVETDLSAYWSVVREAWSGLDLTAIKELAVLGAVLRLVIGLSWDSRNLEHGWLSMEGLRSYQTKLAIAFERLGFAQ